MSDDAIEEALAGLPAESPFGEILRGYASSNPAARSRASQRLTALGWRGLECPPPQDERTALCVLRAVGALPDPKQPPFVADLVGALRGTVHPSLIDPIRELYERASDPLRESLLTLLAAQGTADAVRAFMQLVEAHGRPALSPRLRDELALHNLAHGALLFPALADLEGWDDSHLHDVLLAVLAAGTIEARALDDTRLAKSLPARIEALEARRPVERFDVRYLESQLAQLLDVAGWIGPAEVLPPLERGAADPSTHVARFAIPSLFRRGEDVADAHIARVAADPFVRVGLYRDLAALGHAMRIPPAQRSRSAFATSDLLEWASRFVFELALFTRELELLARFEGRHRGAPAHLYLYRLGLKDGSRAAIAGPYPVSAPEGPLRGASTAMSRAPFTDRDVREQVRLLLEENAWSSAPEDRLTLADWESSPWHGLGVEGWRP